MLQRARRSDLLDRAPAWWLQHMMNGWRDGLPSLPPKPAEHAMPNPSPPASSCCSAVRSFDPIAVRR
jgi:hypothetical protein